MASPDTTPAAAPSPAPPHQAAMSTMGTHSTRPREYSPATDTRVRVIISVAARVAAPAIWGRAISPPGRYLSHRSKAWRYRHTVPYVSTTSVAKPTAAPRPHPAADW